MAIEAAHYRQVENELTHDPIVIAMAAEMLNAPADVKASWTHPDGSPRFEFMQKANTTYRDYGGTATGTHIGAVANAVLALLRR